MWTKRFIFSVAMALALLLTGATATLAQDGKLKIHATPKEAYVFVDGQAMKEASLGSIKLAPGEHKVELRNYGYKPATRSVTITAGKTSTLDVALEAIPGTVSGPWGALTIEGAARNAVLLNGKTPEFFVGHGDEFDHEWWWKQELVVPPGTHQVTILGGDKEIWSGAVNVPAGQRVVLDAHKGVRKTVAWPRGEQLKDVARFKAGIASTTVAVAKPTAQLSASGAEVSCGSSAQLKWSSTDAVHAEISNVGAVATSGEQTVAPKQNTTYTLTASGPGGAATASASVNVNAAIQAKLELTPAEIHYKRVGDQVVEQGSATLTWAANNADAIALEPFGAVGASGNRSIAAEPQKKDPGAVDETVTYTLNAKNACGGAETRTATLHITGVIESPVVKQLEARLALHSIYFPTDQPTARKPDGGLLASQQQTLTSLAADFKKYLTLKPEAHLILSGHADQRGAAGYNKALSERRVERTKRFLVEQGVPVASLETKSFGSEENLQAPEVKKLIEENPDLKDADRSKLLQNLDVIVLANNRRVDVTLSTTGQESIRHYPFNAADSLTLLSKKGVGKEKVKAPAETKAPAAKKKTKKQP
ncbi:MAG: PEGA domain-containing protein [Acidobacteriia bacterium]|nr:PEGA domain-containing protein [Terriglobia bacterium]